MPQFALIEHDDDEENVYACTRAHLVEQGARSRRSGSVFVAIRGYMKDW